MEVKLKIKVNNDARLIDVKTRTIDAEFISPYKISVQGRYVDPNGLKRKYEVIIPCINEVKQSLVFSEYDKEPINHLIHLFTKGKQNPSMPLQSFRSYLIQLQLGPSIPFGKVFFMNNLNNAPTIIDIPGGFDYQKDIEIIYWNQYSEPYATSYVED